MLVECVCTPQFICIYFSYIVISSLALHCFIYLLMKIFSSNHKLFRCTTEFLFLRILSTHSKYSVLQICCSVSFKGMNRIVHCTYFVNLCNYYNYYYFVFYALCCSFKFAYLSSYFICHCLLWFFVPSLSFYFISPLLYRDGSLHNLTVITANYVLKQFS